MGGLYNLVFYVTVDHGQMIRFIKVLNVNKRNENLLLVLHIIPLLIFILSVGYIRSINF